MRDLLVAMICDTGVAMQQLKLRHDRTPAVLRKLAKVETDARLTRRLLMIANALSGMSRVEAGRNAGLDRQPLRDWVNLVKLARAARAGYCRCNSPSPELSGLAPGRRDTAVGHLRPGQSLETTADSVGDVWATYWLYL
jgi:hypothetical protein